MTSTPSAQTLLLGYLAAMDANSIKREEGVARKGKRNLFQVDRCQVRQAKRYLATGKAHPKA